MSLFLYRMEVSNLAEICPDLYLSTLSTVLNNVSAILIEEFIYMTKFLQVVIELAGTSRKM